MILALARARRRCTRQGEGGAGEPWRAARWLDLSGARAKQTADRSGVYWSDVAQRWIAFARDGGSHLSRCQNRYLLAQSLSAMTAEQYPAA